MDLQSYVDRICREFPDFQGKQFRVPEQGMDHIAIIAGDEWVVRFPKLKEYVIHFPEEIRLLDFLHAHVSLPIPHYERIAADTSFGAYKLIAGEKCTPVLFASLPAVVRDKIASQVAEFLSQLHAIDQAQIARCSVADADEHGAFEELTSEYRAFVEPAITAGERRACEAFFGEYEQSIGTAPVRRFIHGDFCWWNILIRDDRTELAGVIDFGDRAIGDPAADIAGLWMYGRAFVESVLGRYTLPIDDGFEEFFGRDFASLALVLAGLMGHAGDAVVFVAVEPGLDGAPAMRGIDAPGGHFSTLPVGGGNEEALPNGNASMPALEFSAIQALWNTDRVREIERTRQFRLFHT